MNQKMKYDFALSGYLIRFSDESEPDLTGEFFDKETDFQVKDGDKIPVYFDHGLDPVFDLGILGHGEIEIRRAGVFIRTEIRIKNQHYQELLDLAETGILGWSSGTASHLVRRQKAKSGAVRITRWPIVEASLTPTPAEPRNRAVITYPRYAEDRPRKRVLALQSKSLRLRWERRRRMVLKGIL